MQCSHRPPRRPRRLGLLGMICLLAACAEPTARPAAALPQRDAGSEPRRRLRPVRTRRRSERPGPDRHRPRARRLRAREARRARRILRTRRAALGASCRARRCLPLRLGVRERRGPRRRLCRWRLHAARLCPVQRGGLLGRVPARLALLGSPRLRGQPLLARLRRGLVVQRCVRRRRLVRASGRGELRRRVRAGLRGARAIRATIARAPSSTVRARTRRLA
jgi:hypothetical protein